MGWVGSGEDFCGLGPEILGWVGLGFEKVTHNQLWWRVHFVKWRLDSFLWLLQSNDIYGILCSVARFLYDSWTSCHKLVTVALAKNRDTDII